MHSSDPRPAVKSSNLLGVRARFQLSRVGILAVSATLLTLTGCAESLPTSALPDLVRDPRKLLTKEEQQQAISDLARKREAQGTRSDQPDDKGE